MKAAGITLFIVFLLFSCQKKQEDALVACSMEYRFVNIEVLGDSLDDYYTIRMFNMDTIRLPAPTIEATYYPVLDDSFSAALKNKQETFIFNGVKNKMVVVSEKFIIGADNCHIIKFSGVVKTSY